MVSEGPLPVVWCVRDNQLVPHQVSGVKLQGAVTGAHIAAVTDFLRMVAGTPIVLPHTALPEDIDNGVNEEKEDSGQQRKCSMQFEVPCVFLTESELLKAKSRSHSMEEKVNLTDDLNTKALYKSEVDNKERLANVSNIMDLLDEKKDNILKPGTEFDKDSNFLNKDYPTNYPCKKIKRIITLDNNNSPLITDSDEVDNETLHRITRFIEIDDNNLFTNNVSDLEKDNSIQRITRVIDLEKDNSFPSMARIIELENEISNERRVSLTNERETGGGIMEEHDGDVVIKSKSSNRSATRFSLDSSCSDNSYVNIESLKSLQDVKKEDTIEGNVSPELTSVNRPLRSRFPKKKTSVGSIGSSDCDDEIDVIFKSKPKSSQWVSLDWIPPPPKEEPVISHVCDKNDFISKWIAEQNSHEVCILPEERRRSLPPKANELYLQSMRRFSDGLQICKEDAASDSPATVKSKWHDIVTRHLHLLKSDRGFKRQRGSWIRTARRLSGTQVNLNSSLESTSLDTYMKLRIMP